MANSKITWTDKESLVTDPTIAEKNKVTDSNMNEIKSVVNENADQTILSDTEPTSADNELWVDTSSNATYINQEVNIGATNPSNIRTWFKVSTNLLDESALVTGGINESTGQDISNATRKRTGYINAKASTKYTLSITAPVVLWLIFYYYDENFTFISSRAQASQTSVTDTSPANTKYIRVVIGNTATEVASNIMLNEGETALPYEPYVRKAININGEDEYFTNDYSTEEQVIGTWLGKPLYRKVVKLTTTQNNDTKTYDLTSLSISEIKHIYGATHFSGYTRNLYNTYAANGTVTEFTGVYIGGNTLTFKSYNSNSGATFYGNVEIIIEYTKTTD